MPSATLKQRAKQICSRDIDKLLRYHLAAGAEKFGATEYGRAMARYHIQFETMRLVVGLQEKAKVSELVFTFPMPLRASVARTADTR